MVREVARLLCGDVLRRAREMAGRAQRTVAPLPTRTGWVRYLLERPQRIRQNSLHSASAKESGDGERQGSKSWRHVKAWAAIVAIGGGSVKLIESLYPDWHEIVSNYQIAYAEAKLKFLKSVDERFTVGTILGSGGFAKVYKAVDKACSNQQVALKIMLKENPESLKVFEDEVKVMTAAGVHENLVSLHGTFETPQELCLILDLADGGALFDRILDQGTLNEAQASSYVLQLTQALLHLHRRSIAHADVKPENLLLTSADPNASIKLCDFGMAKEIGDTEEWFGDRCGTLDYWSPEMVRKQPCGTAVDMWALGCVIYIMLCGCNPFNPYGVDSDTAILASIAGGKIDTSNPVWRHLSAPCRDFIVRLMSVDVAKRLTAEDALQHPWLAGEAPSANLPEVHRQRLKGYQALSKLRTAVQALAINTDALFNLLDRDRSGALDRDELYEAFTAVGIKLSSDALQAIFDLGDKSRDGRISRSEFQQMLGVGNARMQQKELGEEQLRQLFDIFDSNKDGTISPEEMQHVLNMLGRKMTLRRATSIVSKVHTGKGEMNLDFKQFCKIMRMNLLHIPVDD